MGNFEKFGRILLPDLIAKEQHALSDEREFARSKIEKAPKPQDKDEPDSNRKPWQKRTPASAPEWEEPLEKCGLPVMQIIDREEVEAHTAILASQPDDDSKHKTAALLRSLLPLGELRKLHRRPTFWKRELNALEKRFPHFAEVIQHIRVCCALSERSGAETIHIDHLLLSGPPGIGKTYFAGYLAKFLRGETAVNRTLTIRMADQQSNSALSGSATFWANCKPSLLLEELLFKGYANPVVILDELDKTHAGNGYDPLASLYTLWEQSSAKCWNDLCYPWMTVNASRVVWIATCNEHSLVPAAILSRTRVFQIQPPTKAEAISVAEVIAWETMEECLPFEAMSFEDSAIAALAVMSPRRQRAAVKNALGAVALRDDDVVTAADIEPELARAKMGFI